MAKCQLSNESRTRQSERHVDLTKLHGKVGMVKGQELFLDSSLTNYKKTSIVNICLMMASDEKAQ